MENHSRKSIHFPNRVIFAVCIIILFMVMSYLNKTKANTVNKNEIVSDKQYLNVKEYKNEDYFVKKIKSNACEPNKETPYILPKSQIKKVISNNDYEHIFEDDLFIGDSITTGLYIYKLINEKNVSAKKGIDTIHLSNEVGKIKIKKPENIYILCGINDLIGSNDCRIFSTHYNELINIVKSQNSSANIYVQSILLVYKGVENSKPNIKNEYIIKFNAVLQDIAKQQNVKYIDISSLVDCNDKKLYQNDGIHLKPNFYYSWLACLVEKTKK